MKKAGFLIAVYLADFPYFQLILCKFTFCCNFKCIATFLIPDFPHLMYQFSTDFFYQMLVYIIHVRNPLKEMSEIMYTS